MRIIDAMKDFDSKCTSTNFNKASPLARSMIRRIYKRHLKSCKLGIDGLIQNIGRGIDNEKTVKVTTVFEIQIVVFVV